MLLVVGGLLDPFTGLAGAVLFCSAGGLLGLTIDPA
jgi:hypothetical protein